MTRIVQPSVLDLVEEYKEKLSRAKAPDILPSAKVLAETAGHRVVLVDMGTLSANVLSFNFDVKAYSIHIAKAGSDPVAVLADLREAGVFGPLYPGVTVRPHARFQRVSFRKWMSPVSPAAGTFTDVGVAMPGRFFMMVVGKTPEAQYLDWASGDHGGFTHQRTSANQNYNATNNVPTSATDGIRARGARAIRAGLLSQNGNILGGTCVWWYDPFDNGSWGETDVQQPLVVNGRTQWWGAELECAHSCGRYFAEFRTVTLAGGAGPFLGYMFSHGEGGELNVGEVQP